MRKTSLLIFLTPLIFVTSAHAQSSANVEIHNSVNSTSTSNSTTTSHTDVTVETNGKVTHYTSDEPNQNVKVQAVNGVSSINVDGKEVAPNTSVVPTKTVTPNPSVTKANTTTVVIVKQNGFINMIKLRFAFLKKFFPFLDG